MRAVQYNRLRSGQRQTKETTAVQYEATSYHDTVDRRAWYHRSTGQPAHPRKATATLQSQTDYQYLQGTGASALRPRPVDVRVAASRRRAGAPLLLIRARASALYVDRASRCAIDSRLPDAEPHSGWTTGFMYSVGRWKPGSSGVWSLSSLSHVARRGCRRRLGSEFVGEPRELGRHRRRHRCSGSPGPAQRSGASGQRSK